MKLKKSGSKKTEQTNTQDNVVKSLFKSPSTSEEHSNDEPKKDIRDIVDYTRPFNIFYSGVEDQFNFNILYDMGIRNFLMSYHYIQNKHLDTKMYQDKGVKFFIDSGAYTYQVDPKYADTTIEDWEKHIVRYLNWAKKHKDMIFAIANLDLENLYGPDQVKQWNEKYFEPFMLETGIPVCFIWHPINTELGWEKYCQRYPYVGMSWVSDEGTDLDFNFGKNMLRVAEKYNTLVHGMGMTRTSLLTKLNFYTSDSTTWLVGLQYGEINYWNGQKMQRLKKDKWKGSYLDRICEMFHLDSDAMLNEDTEEMIKANVGAFIEAEKFIQSQAKSRYYWLKPKKKERNSIEGVDYPTVDWLRGNTEYSDWEHYAEVLNISKELDSSAVINLIIDTTLFSNRWNEPYKSSFENTYTEEMIKEIHDEWINRLVPSTEDMVEDLVQFFTEVVLGTQDKLLMLGTNFDRIVKEREDKDYITDEEYDYVDASEMEIQNVVSKFLPPPKEGSPAPEIDDLDDEIFAEAGIIPIRDDKGRFLKGQKAVARPKKLYSKKYPKLACDTCFNAQKCPEYKAGYACAYNKMFDRFNTRDMGDIIQAMQGIVDFSLTRLQRGMLTETLEGGLPDPNVTGMMNQTMGYLAQLQKMYEFGSQEVLRQTKIMRADGSQEVTTQVSNPQQGGILEKIFGGMSSEPEEPKTEEVTDVETSDKKEE